MGPRPNVSQRTNVLAGALVLGFCISDLFAQASNKSNPTDFSRSTITGRVVARDKPLAGAVLTLWWGFSEPTPDTTAGIARTDASGNYELTNVRPGNYFISVKAIGFVTGQENQTILNIRPVTVVGTNGIAPINFELVLDGASFDPHGEFILQHLSAGEYTLAVFAHGANSPEWKAEQQIVIPDDKV